MEGCRPEHHCSGGDPIQNSGNYQSISSDPERNRIAWFKLKLIPGLGNTSILRLLEVFGSPEKVLAARADELCQTGLPLNKALRALASKQFAIDPEPEWKKFRESGFRLICVGDDEYPANLAKIPDRPAVLFSSGLPAPRDLISIAVVGSRLASPAGILFTQKLASDLALSGITVVSGLALGIDSAAHRGALKAGGRTLAVLGCGLGVNYPAANADLRQEITRSGVLLTEFPPGTPPASGNFPSRNRIISGLTLGVVVVEAAERSGSLITARFALEQGREVFAVPGVAGSTRSQGAHRLLKQGAKLVECVEDILEEIRPLIRPTPSSESSLATSPGEKGEFFSPPFSKGGQGGFENPASPEETLLLRVLDKVPKHIDEIAREARISVQHASSILLELELRGLVSQLPGKYFICSQ
jgi:DNA processing protein